jgi:hypothetical protein
MMMKRYILLLSCLLPFLLATVEMRAETWPQFRGATGDGFSPESNLPTKWSDSEHVLWSAPLKGRANSSPAVTSKRVDITTTMEDNSLWVLSFDRKSGKPLRSVNVGNGKLAAAGPAKLYAHRHNAATPSPVADEDHIWAFFGSGMLVCLDASTGSVQWKRDLANEYGEYDITFGMGSSPRLSGDLLFIACITKGPSYVLALDKTTGKEVWKSDRRLPAKDDGPDAYISPTIATIDGQEQLLISGSDHVNAYDPKSGKQLWISSGLTINSPYGRIIASPAAAQDIVLATTGNPAGAGLGHVMALRAKGRGDISGSSELWRYPKSTPDSSTPVIVDGNVYMTTDMGVATCMDLKTGKVHWTKRLGTGPFHASLVAGDGKIYFLNIDGVCTVVEAGIEGKILGTNELTGTFYATPAISDGVIYLRAYERLVAISE